MTESHQHGRSVSLGIFVLQGSRDEDRESQGFSHFLEHLVFKGTKTRSAFQIAHSLESLGGDLNAYTGKEYTCYHALVLKDHWPKALEVLCDLVSNMEIKPEDFQTEQRVILQEMAMSDDQHEDLIYDEYFKGALGQHGLAHPILGTERSLKKFQPKSIQKSYGEKYCGSRLIVSVAGPVKHKEIALALSKELASKKRGTTRKLLGPPVHRPLRKCFEKNAEQLHLLMGIPCSSFQDKDRFEAFLANALIGGGMTSQLYQKIREERGLAYSISSQLHTFFDFGFIAITAASEPNNMKEILKVLHEQLRLLRNNPVPADQLEMLKTQVMGSVLLGADDVENRMTSIAINEMVFGHYRPVEDVIQEINSITAKSLSDFLKKRLNPDKMGLVLLGANAKSYQATVKNWGREN